MKNVNNAEARKGSTQALGLPESSRDVKDSTSGHGSRDAAALWQFILRNVCLCCLGTLNCKDEGAGGSLKPVVLLRCC